MGYTKVIGSFTRGNLTKYLDTSNKNPKFSLDLKLVNVVNHAEHYIVAVVKHNRRKDAINLSVHCNGILLADDAQDNPYWETVEIPLGIAVRLSNGQYRFEGGLSHNSLIPDSLWRTRLNDFRISVTSFGDGNLFTADIEKFLYDAGKGIVTIHS